MPITRERLGNLLKYDPAIGHFIWLVSRGKARKDSVAGTVKPDNGYIQIRIDGANYLAHRLVWLYMTGVWPNPEIDHENGIRSDNRWSNLREATREQNSRNTRLPPNISGFRGVYSSLPGHPSFYFQIRAGNGRRICKGGFATAEEAFAARNLVLRDLHGVYAAPAAPAPPGSAI